MFKHLLCFMTIIVILIFNLSANELVDKHKINLSKIDIKIEDEPAILLGGQKITIGDAIKKAIEMNLDIIQGSYDVAMTDTMIQELKQKYAPYLISKAGTKYAQYPEALAIYSGQEITSVNGQAIVSKRFKTGTTVSGGISYEFADTEREMPEEFAAFGDLFGLSVSHAPVVFINLKQELLKNAFGYNEKRLLTQLDNYAAMQKDGIIYALSYVIVGVIYDYWNMITKKEALSNSITALNATKNVQKVNVTNVKYGLAETFTENYYNLLIEGAESAKILAEQEFKSAKRKFLSTVNLNSNLMVDDSIILTNKLPIINKETAVAEAYSKRADLLNAKRSLKNAKLDLDIIKNERLPELNALFDANTLGYQDGFGGSFKDTATFAYPTFEFGLMLTMPLDNPANKVKSRNAKFNIKKAQIQYDKIKRKVKDDVEEAIEKIEMMHKLVQKTKIARKEAETFYNKMLIRLKRGKLNSATVKNGIDALIESRKYELETLVAYNLALISFQVAKNKLWEFYDIDVEKYIPKDI
ncbi:MAG: TolC family protein [Pseudomonadota bacterium]